MTSSLVALFLDTCRRHAHRPAMVHRTHSGWQVITWEQCRQDVEALANAFIADGLAPGDRVALLCETRPEWVIADLAMQAVGLVSVPIYPTLTAPQVGAILRHCEARGLIVSNRRQLDKAMALVPDCPDLRRVLLIDPIPVLEPDIPVTGWQEALQLGRHQDAMLTPQRLARMAAVATDACCTILYTSGTTGSPKGVMLSQANLVANVEAILGRCPLSPQDTSLSFLPLSHGLERITTYALIASGATIAYAGSLDALSHDLAEIRPTVMAAVPRVLEKIHDRIREGLLAKTGAEVQLFDWALAVGGQRWVDGGAESPGYAVADALVLKGIRERFGGRMRTIICGGAPMNAGIGAFLHSTGIAVYEGYGLAEASPMVTMNGPGAFRFGTVGQVLPGVTLRLADDGEICVQGPNVMLGYYQDEAETAAVLTEDGWLHTGDIGELDGDGFVTITNRKKELIVLSNGNTVAPQALETRLQQSPFIEQVLLVGDRHPYLTALVVPAFETVSPWAFERSLPLDREPLIHQPEVRGLIGAEISRLSGDLAAFEKIRHFTLVAQAWTIDSGELTPTQKLRRAIILTNHAEAIEGMYASAVV
jgi:long-chain acyl-CoA synthetase